MAVAVAAADAGIEMPLMAVRERYAILLDEFKYLACEFDERCGQQKAHQQVLLAWQDGQQPACQPAKTALCCAGGGGASWRQAGERSAGCAVGQPDRPALPAEVLRALLLYQQGCHLLHAGRVCRVQLSQQQEAGEAHLAASAKLAAHNKELCSQLQRSSTYSRDTSHQGRAQQGATVA